MNRELKFKAWDKEANRMGWVTLINYTHEGEVYEIIVDYLHAEIDDSFNITLSPDNCELLQFTGLHDKNGKEIYEGDIVQRGVIVFERGKFQGCYFDGNGNLEECWEDDLYQERKIEVLGNIYENPELLKA